MGQRLGNDKIGKWTNNGSAASIDTLTVTVGGQQYSKNSLSVSYPSWTTGLYKIYAVLDNSVMTLKVSLNENSIGPAGYESWKLVGAYYTNEYDSQFGAFVNIEGKPETEMYSSHVTGSWTNTNYSGFRKRVGDMMVGSSLASIVGTPQTTFLHMVLPDGAVMDTTKMNTAGRDTVGSAFIRGPSRGYPAITAFYTTTGFLIYHAETTGNASSFVTESSPLSFASGMFVSSEFSVPIVGWTNTPLVDL